MESEKQIAILMEQAVQGLFRAALRLTFNDPSQAFFSLRTVRWQKKAARLRFHWQAAGVPVPPVMMMSVTDRCNLRCQGCFAQAHQSLPRAEMDQSKVRNIFTEAKELGISVILLLGGEPLIRKEILNITRDFPEIIFPLFSNGLFMNGDLLGKFKEQKNVVPVFSLEGCQEETDGRRGPGVYRHLQGLIPQMKKENIFWGLSFTLTRPNFNTVTDARFIEGLVDAGCRLFFFVEFTPMNGGTQNWVLTGEQRDKVLGVLNGLEYRFPGLFIAFPGGEERFGGCLSAGRGFVHISPDGDVEPCPFVPYSDSNLKNLSLKEALQSEFLRDLRQNRPERTGDKQGGCVLRENNEWVRALLHSKGNATPKGGNAPCEKR
jgi:MoaA/NifB/PqqE/SkfB family radical SAM enzyme